MAKIRALNTIKIDEPGMCDSHAHGDICLVYLPHMFYFPPSPSPPPPLPLSPSLVSCCTDDSKTQKHGEFPYCSQASIITRIEAINHLSVYHEWVLFSSNMEVITQWWIKSVSYASRKILLETPAIVLQTDASALGWGATGTNTSCGGRWNVEEVPLLEAHGINYLELAAATSAAKDLDVPIDRILEAAGWASERMFHKYYHKEIADPGAFGGAVLDSVLNVSLQ
ncbi:uncharacterized protein LOC129701887 [Leucoraja erinacea]|uniref:uncharacterized protein LOC129701887 n=1 Tax=Leucoraja erinaceus TaxID=7782 RepID=UPI00245607DB|nr:uncharacterized protein LOC129701887 [Leucoraja erinacea]